MRIHACVPNSILAVFASLLPSLGLAAVGATSGTANVTRNGAATYDVQLTLPPDRLVPSLGISYSHLRGNGLLGMGFALSGFSTIQRCSRTIAQDGVASPLIGNDTGDDGYCLDGNRLRLVSGTYGQPNSTYRTEIEIFARITAHGTASAISSWTVDTRDGLIQEFGNTTNSRIIPPGGTHARIWALNRTRDRVGNYVDYDYELESQNGTYRPKEVTYAGNLPQGVAPATRVAFVYETTTRMDPIYQYRGGAVNIESKRLQRIDIVHIATSEVLRTYQLAYEINGGAGLRARLQSLQECSAGDCLAATTFQWMNGTSGWGAETATGFTINPFAALILDFDNDGQDDIAYSSTAAANGTGTWMVMRGSNAGLQAPLNTTAPTWFYHQAQVIEWDGDGFPDVLVPCSNGTTWCVFYERTGTAPNRVFVSTPLNTGIAIAQTGTASAHEWLAADVNGDGKSDLVRMARPASGSDFLAVGIRSGSGFLSEVTAYAETDVEFKSSFTFQNFVGRRNWNANGRVDYDGDGREDFYMDVNTPAGGGLAIFRGFDSATSSTPNYIQRVNLLQWVDSGVMHGDLNGDGLTDLIKAADDAVLVARYGNGVGVTAEEAAGPPLEEWAVGAIADMDADGRSDILGFNPFFSGNWLVSRSLGNGLADLVDIGLAAPSGSTFSADVNGDGLQDLIRTVSSANNEARVRLHNGVVPDLLDRVTDGFGNFVDFDYRSTALDGSFYTPNSVVPTYPARNHNRPMILVERYTANDGIGGTYTVRFEYKGGVLNLQGRGFQGFSERKVFDSRDNRVLHETLSTTFPHNGRVVQEQLTAAGEQVYVRTVTPSAHVYGSGSATRHFPYTATETIDQYGDSGNVTKQVTSTNTVDVWGTTTEQSVLIEEVSGGLNPGATHSIRTLHPLVANDQTNWCLGKPTQTQHINTHSLPGGAQRIRTMNQSWDTTLCRLTGTVVEPGDPKWQVSTTYGYDDFGNVDTVTVTPAVGQGQSARVTSVEWDATGRFPLTITNPLQHETTFAWDVKRGLRTDITTPNDLTLSFQHDALGRVTRIANLDGTATDLVLSWCTTFACQGTDPNIRVLLQEISKTTGNAEITQVRHYLDAYGREVLVQSKLLDGTYTNSRRVFDARGLVHQTSRPFTVAANAVYETVTYDHLLRPTLIRRPTSDSDPTNHDVSFVYDDLETTRTDALGRTSITYVDAVGRVIRMVDAGNSATEYEYDAFGNLVTTRDPLGAVISATYNVRGMKMSTNDPNMGSWTYDYFPLGELKSQTDAKNQTITFTYDNLSRLLNRTMPEGAGSITATFIWGNSSAAKNIGELQSSQISGTGITTYQEAHVYDAKGRLSQTTYSEGATNYLVNFGYNATTGFPETITYPTSTSGFRMPLLYEYQNGLPSRVSSNGTQWWVANASDASGNVTDATLGDATSGMTIEMLSSYDSVTNLLQSRGATWDSGTLAGTVISNLAYLYDRAGNVIQRQNNQQGLTENFYYDSLDRLDYSTRGSQTTDYTYDVRGNITAKTGVGTTYSYTVNVAGCTYYSHAQIHAVRQITGGSSTMNFCYDANGNMTNRNGTSLTWFADNLSKAITKDASNSSNFEYTPTGQRWRHAYRTAGSTYTHTYIGKLVEKVVGPTTTDWKHYVFVNGEAIGLYIRSSNGAKSTHYFVKDNISGMAAIAQSNGNWTMPESFDAFGQRRGPLSWSGSPSAADLNHMRDTTRRGFTSHEHLDSTGLIHMNGRVYDPVIGRFASADPFVQAPFFSQSLNRYSYVLNSPLKYTDPSGFGPDDFWDLDDFIDFDDWLDWDTYFPGNDRSAEVDCNGASPERCALFHWNAAMFLACGFNRRCQENWMANNPRPGTSPPAAPPPVPPAPPAPPPEPPPTPRPPPTPIPTPTPPDPTPTTIRDLASATTVPSSGGLVRTGYSGGDLVGDYIPELGPSSHYACAKTDACGNRGPVSTEQAVVETLIVGGIVVGGIFSAEIVVGAAAAVRGAKLAIDANKLIHIFGQARHKLGPLVQQFGSREAAFRAVQKAAQAAVRRQGLTGNFETTVSVAGQNVVVRGTVIDGVARIGTFFIP